MKLVLSNGLAHGHMHRGVSRSLGGGSCPVPCELTRPDMGSMCLGNGILSAGVDNAGIRDEVIFDYRSFAGGTVTCFRVPLYASRPSRPWTDDWFYKSQASPACNESNIN